MGDCSERMLGTLTTGVRKMVDWIKDSAAWTEAGDNFEPGIVIFHLHSTRIT